MSQRVFRAARWCVLAILAFCVLWGCTSAPIELYTINLYHEPMQADWVQVVDGTAVPLADLQEITPVQAGETLVLETTLAQVLDDTVFIFFSKNQEVRIFLDDALVYEFVIQDGFASLQTPGNEWNEVFLSDEMSGATLRIELTSQFDYYSNLLYDFYMVHYNDMLSLQLEWLWLRIAAGMFLFAVALFSYIKGGLWYGTETRRFAMRMGDFYMTLSLWVFANAGALDLIFRRPVVSHLIEMVAIRLVPVMAYLFVRNILSRKYRMYDAIGWLVFANLLGSVILQFCFGVPLLSTLWVTHVILVFGVLLDFGIVVWHLYRTRNTKAERNYLFICTPILFASALLEVWRFYALPAKDAWISAYIAVAYLLYAIISHLIMTHRSAGLDRGRIALETNYNKLQNTTLMRQINAHFFFNTLNGISAQCKSDPEQADETVNLLAKYMRHYMYFVNTTTPIHFVNELDLMRVYLSIEQTRFKGSFSVTIDTPFTDFDLPALSIQPIVENAVMHGLRQCERYGEIIITSEKQGKNAVVTVRDNGVGFDTGALDDAESIALHHIRTQLADMVGGTLEIESNVGKGTKATVTIPLGKHAYIY